MEKCCLLCHSCGAKRKICKISQCPECGGILTVEYSDEYLREISAELLYKETNGMWGFGKLLPEVSEENIVSLGEGGTPLVKSHRLAQALGLTELYMKDETKNPTGSFKDRSVSVCVSMAKEFHCPGIVVSSSGNGGAAASAYGAIGGIDTIIFVPERTPVGKVAQAICYGGKVIKVEGNFSCSYCAAEAMAEKKNYMNVTTTFINPYGLEGYKTIAFEIFANLRGAPDFIFIPVGAGPVLYAVWKGFSEMKRMGWIKKLPRLVCCQAKGCSPIVDAWKEKRKTVRCETPETVASAICDPLTGYERDGDITVEAIRESDGVAVALEDDELLEAGKRLARQEGLFVEVSSAASLAGLMRCLREGKVTPEDRCICLLTGHGLKDSMAYLSGRMDIPVINAIEE